VPGDGEPNPTGPGGERRRGSPRRSRLPHGQLGSLDAPMTAHSSAACIGADPSTV
jgi:hypothetical protein